MADEPRQCPLCSSFDDPATYRQWFHAKETDRDTFAINCRRCGEFEIGSDIVDDGDGKKRLTELGRQLSAAARAGTEADRAVIAARVLLPDEAAGGVLNHLQEMSLIKLLDRDALRLRIQLTPDGWKRVDQYRKGAGRGERVFVAMWFDDSMKDAYEKVSRWPSRIPATSAPSESTIRSTTPTLGRARTSANRRSDSRGDPKESLRSCRRYRASPRRLLRGWFR